ncbi:CB1 cannabinoid receptor-interacting protein 1b [Pangasianodon hypophthalmus]|uniref:CB1 cannabinoid receptor-interacting protein 1b n=1 Tax=Pangasianodon hypophthalmus TaxID=310915 RepID=UPI0023077811|nr:CB1 cannabinoid receptor-interacting protein 1b [Pangasianodon hypophthalmus]
MRTEDLSCESMSVGGVTFPLKQKSKDPQAVVYSVMYDTEGVAHTKRECWTPLHVIILILFYFLHSHLFPLYSFHSIEYECKPNETHSLMWISKETFCEKLLTAL